MHVAILSLLSQSITATAIGGTEIFTYHLIEQLIKNNITVTLYCAKDSKTAAQHHVEICDPSLPKETVANMQLVYPYTVVQINRFIEDAKHKKFDLVHANFYKTFLLSARADQVPIPILYTVHGDFLNYPEISAAYEHIGFKDNEHYAYVSHNAQDHGLIKHNSHVIHNGIPLNRFPESTESNQNKLLWLSRLDPAKGALEAIEVATKTQKSLMLSGFIDKKKFPDYFDSNIKPHLNQFIEFQEGSSASNKIGLYQQAKAFLFPIQWEEPFGLVFLEAMACGTPIITYARGASAEIVKDGVGGFLVNPSADDIRGNWIVKKTGREGLQEAVERIYALSPAEYTTMRKACRAQVEKYFTIDHMTRQYIDLYNKISQKNS